MRCDLPGTGAACILGSAVAAALLCVVATGVADAGPTEVGAVAPANSWLTEGGCAARTGAAETRGLRGSLERSWDREFDGEIVGEPLVAADRVLVEVLLKPGLREIVTLSLADGGEQATKRFRTSHRLYPTLQRNVLVLAGDEKLIEAHRVRRGSIDRIWKVEVTHPIQSVVAVGSQVYTRSAQAIERHDVGRYQTVWSVPGTYRGRLAVRGKHVYGVRYDPAGNAEVVMIDRDTGRERPGAGVGHHDGAVPDGSDDVGLAVHRRAVFVHHTLVVTGKSGARFNTTWLSRTPLQGVPTLRFASLLALRGETVPSGAGWVGNRENAERGGYQVIAHGTDDSYRILATASAHADLLGEPFLPSVASGVVRVGGHSFDAVTRERLWSLDVTPLSRVVPARDCVLVVEGTKKLIAFRETDPPARAEPWVDGDFTGEVSGRVVLVNGEVEEGPFVIDRDAATLTRASKHAPLTWPLTDVQVLDDADDRLRIAADDQDLLDGLEALGDHDLADAYSALARRAGAAKDRELTERLLAAAFAYGATERDLKPAAAALKRLVRRNKPAVPDDQAVAAIAADERAKVGEILALPWTRASSLPDDAPPRLRVDLLRAVLTRDPAHVGARKAARELVPPELAIAETADPLEVLDLAEAVRQSPVTRVTAPEDPSADMSRAERTLGIQLHTWRADLQAVQSKQLLVLSVIDRPGSLAKTLSMGELVCDSLEALFAGGTRQRETRWPLTIRLYTSKEEYRKESGRRGGHHGALAWSAGHYSPTDEMSSLYLPEDDDEFRTVMHVFAHELTHQWLAERCPLFGTVDTYGSGSHAYGNWIVEGFASVIEELEFDLEKRTWSFDPHASSLATISAAPASALIPWDKLLAMGYDEMSELGDDEDTKVIVADPHRLGAASVLRPINLYYDQSTVVTAYLFHAEDGRHRAKLVEYVGAHYRGEKPQIKAFFGLEPKALGQKALAWAKALQAR